MCNHCYSLTDRAGRRSHAPDAECSHISGAAGASSVTAIRYRGRCADGFSTRHPRPAFAGQVIAFTIFIVTLFGEGLGPLVVALITDYGFGDDLALCYSMSAVAAIITPLAALIFWSGLKSYRADMTAANNDNRIDLGT